MTVAELHRSWAFLDGERQEQITQVEQLSVEMRQLILQWLHDNPGRLRQLRGHRSLRGVARNSRTNYAYVQRFEAGDIHGISSEALAELFRTYTRFEKEAADGC